MNILTGTQIKEADRFTMETEPIASLDLMERASGAVADWFKAHIGPNRPLLFLIGKGNNGGDGLAVARMLAEAGYACSMFSPFSPDEMTEECRANLHRLPDRVRPLLRHEALCPPKDALLVDALLGTGVRGGLKEPLASLIPAINRLPNEVVAIDLPSGMATEWGNDPARIVHATHTLALECPKLAMMLPEAGDCCGRLHVLPIGLAPAYPGWTDTPYSYTGQADVTPLLLRRRTFAHKGDYGHALLVCGSARMMGAAVLATGGALRSGCALVTAHVPRQGAVAMNVAFPSAMLSLDPADSFSALPEELARYRAIGTGCGLGMDQETVAAFGRLLQAASVPMVLDADALNILARHGEWLGRIPSGSILTPHPGELQRLIGNWNDEKEKIEKACALAARLRSVVVVKGAHTMVVMPDRRIRFNSTGNPGMAKGGSGDVLTGLLTGLLARGYDSEQAAVIGVYCHGLAGDAAARKHGEESMNSRDLVDELKIGRFWDANDANNANARKSSCP